MSGRLYSCPIDSAPRATAPRKYATSPTDRILPPRAAATAIDTRHASQAGDNPRISLLMRTGNSELTVMRSLPRGPLDDRAEVS